jgi:predicted dehydrogenase
MCYARLNELIEHVRVNNLNWQFQGETMKKVKIGLIGAGFMGNTHAASYKTALNIFGQDIVPEFVRVSDIDPERAAATARRHGFASWCTDWHDVVSHPEIDLVDIATFNDTHVEIAMAAAHAGKHIYCEKPLAMNGRQALAAVQAVEEAGVATMVGFNYIHNPIQTYVRQLLESGELGRVVSFRGTFDQDYYAEKDTLHTWRFLKKASASGALGDLASHTISLSQYLVGDIKSVCGLTDIIFPQRPDPADPSRLLPVENDDVVQFMFRYQNGATGVILSNRVACGHKLSLTYEIQLTEGSVIFNQERQNEVQIYRHNDPRTERGFKTVYIAPGHGLYDRFYGGAGIGLGYADMKVIEAYLMLRAVACGEKPVIDFRFGSKVNLVIDAVLQSAESGSWVAVTA